MSDPIPRLNAALEGRYVIERELGEGGMATVYLARDERHNRNVALKVLKPELAAVLGADRFLAEIETTANLQHPHILPLFDSGEADGFLFYVMPFIEGETLRDRIDRERQLPVDEAIGIATAVANALQTAHERGVVHRDIKPGNILLSQGQPLVADFGIALAVSSGGGGRLTETGLSLGTPYYMSPEQATGDQAIGPASDTFALACVLYEMLTGEPPYPGNTAQAVLGKIIQGQPVSATAVRRSVPANVDAAIRKALEKLPADRFTAAQDFARALADQGFRHGNEALPPSGDAAVWRRRAVAATAVAALFALTTAWGAFSPEPALPTPGLERFATPFMEDQHPAAPGRAGFELSPDGSMLVYRGENSLVVRRWDDLASVPIRETERGFGPEVSHDGLEVAFFHAGGAGEVKVLALAGGPLRHMMEGILPIWGGDGYLYATTEPGVIARVPQAGGAVEVVSELQDGDQWHVVFDMLPGGRAALVEVESQSAIEVRTLDLRTRAMTRLVEGRSPRYAASGHLVYHALDNTVMAARFDPERMEMLGPAVPVIEAVNYWSLSDDGKFFYSRGNAGSGAAGPEQQVAWVDRRGEATPVDPSWFYQRGQSAEVGFAFSPDGSRVALREYSSGGYDIWVKQLDTGPHERLTFDGADEKMPAWHPDGASITYLSNRNGNFDVWSRAADGSGEPELLLDLEEDLNSARWSPDGEWLVLWTANEDILAYRPGDGAEPIRLLAGDYDEQDPVVSPDGRWIAYASDETGENHVYVRPFPDVNGGRWQISTEPARYPRWAHNGRELFYQDNGPSPDMWVVEYATGDAFQLGSRVRLFDSPGWVGSGQYGEAFEIEPGDERFIVPVIPQRGEATEALYVLINNFFGELERLAPR